MPEVTLVKEPTVFVLAEMGIDRNGYSDMLAWLKEFAPDCLDPSEEGEPEQARIFPHEEWHDTPEGTQVSDNELLVELSGRKCYNSFGKKAGRRNNAAYIANLFGQPGKIPHASVLYHAKMTFFFAGIGRRVSHELIRHYVGADRTEEGCPSQESTRYTHHSGHFSVHPRLLEHPDQEGALDFFRKSMQAAYDAYLEYIDIEVSHFKARNGKEPKGMDRKRIYEAAAQMLPGAACTSFIWTTNPMALQKVFTERTDFAADLEIQRFGNKLKDVCHARWPSLFRESNLEYQHG